MTDWTIVLSGLGRNPLRLLLTTLVAFIGFGLFAIVLGVFVGLSTTSSETSTRLISADPVGFTRPLPIGHLARIRETEGVRDVSPVSIFGGYQGERHNQIMTFVVDGAVWTRLYPDIAVSGADLAAFQDDRSGLMVGRGIAEREKWSVGDQVALNSVLFRRADGDPLWQLTVRAIFEDESAPTGSQYAVLHREYVEEGALSTGHRVNWFVIGTEEGVDPMQVSGAIDSQFTNSLDATQTRTEDAFNAAFLQQFGDITLVVTLVVATSMASLLLIVANSVAMNVRERWGELAALRAIGFPKGRILRMVVMEGATLCSFGGGVGVLVACGALFAISNSFDGAIGVSGYILPIAGAGLLLAAALGALAALAPALEATRVSVASAFRRA